MEDSQAQPQEVKRFSGLVKELHPQLEQQTQRQVVLQRVPQAERQPSRGGLDR